MSRFFRLSLAALIVLPLQGLRGDDFPSHVDSVTCIYCGQVSWPHDCPHLKRFQQNYSYDDEPRPAPRPRNSEAEERAIRDQWEKYWEDVRRQQAEQSEYNRRVMEENRRIATMLQFNNLGNAAFASGRYSDAVGYYQSALTYDPDERTVQNNLAQAHRLQFVAAAGRRGYDAYIRGDFAVALEEFNLAAQSWPNNPTIIGNIEATRRKLTQIENQRRHEQQLNKWVLNDTAIVNQENRQRALVEKDRIALAITRIRDEQEKLSRFSTNLGNQKAEYDAVLAAIEIRTAQNNLDNLLAALEIGALAKFLAAPERQYISDAFAAHIAETEKIFKTEVSAARAILDKRDSKRIEEGAKAYANIRKLLVAAHGRTLDRRARAALEKSSDFFDVGGKILGLMIRCQDKTRSPAEVRADCLQTVAKVTLVLKRIPVASFGVAVETEISDYFEKVVARWPVEELEHSLNSNFNAQFQLDRDLARLAAESREQDRIIEAVTQREKILGGSNSGVAGN